MDKDTRLTPGPSRLRRYLVRWADESERGQRFARWVGKAAGGLQLRLKMKAPDVIPWTPLKRPLAEATVAIVTTGGVHPCAGKPFDFKGDASFRAIARTATPAELRITHERYERRDAARDLNLVFPLERLLELEAEGIVGRVADTHYGFGFTENPLDLLPSGRELGSRFAQAHVDLVVLMPA